MTETEIATRITSDPGIYRGKPIIRGTRIPVDLIVDFLANGETIEQIVDDYPGLTPEDVEAAVAYAETHKLVVEVRPWSV